MRILAVVRYKNSISFVDTAFISDTHISYSVDSQEVLGDYTQCHGLNLIAKAFLQSHTLPLSGDRYIVEASKYLAFFKN